MSVYGEKASELVSIVVDTVDVGLTQKVTIRVNSHPIVSYRPGTRHPERAIESGREMVANALQSLLLQAVENDPHAKIVDHDDDGVDPFE